MDARELIIGNIIGINLKDDDQNFFKVLALLLMDAMFMKAATDTELNKETKTIYSF